MLPFPISLPTILPNLPLTAKARLITSLTIELLNPNLQLSGARTEPKHSQSK